jgi:PBP4 family serine-type D-alanyl-D-alanine carboxypeptidase
MVCHSILAVAASSLVLSPSLLAQPTFAERLLTIMNQPEFAHSNFGVAVYSLDGQRLFGLNENKFFVPGSTTKLLTEGTALALLGANYRFHTRVYRTGTIDSTGVLNGDIILVASGDPNLSGRVQPDDTMAFEDEDHSYGGLDSKGLPGDPLLAINELADKIAAKGVKKIAGRVLIDASLFPEGERELGTGVVISPIMVNDNVIDVVVAPGESEGAPIKLQVRPETTYAKFVNNAKTGKPGSPPDINFADSSVNNQLIVTVTGSLPIGRGPALESYKLLEPSRFASVALSEALRKRGVDVKDAQSTPSDYKAAGVHDYDDAHLLAEHISPPLSEEVKVTLKVSQNLHASMTPFLLGAVLGQAKKDIDQAGFEKEHDFLKAADLDLSGAVQSDGAGGNAYFTPDFMVHYLLYMSKRPDFLLFRTALPILGRDGSLFKIQPTSPAAGHVFAKTGTYAVYDALNKKLMVTGKGLAGYIDTKSGQHLVFAAYVNMIDVSLDPDAVQEITGQALGKIAAAAYDSVIRQ